jgi:hypothetical protein
VLTPADEREIVALLTRYATGIDTRNWPLFESCFAADARTDYGAFGRWTSAAQITAFMRDAHAEVGLTLHRLSNFVVTAEGEGAGARSYIDALLMPISPGGDIHRGVGFYDDELTKTVLGWKIQRRRFTAVQIL